ncbi:MAG TPA: DMT family transporter [Devosia sp.]|nr:DMT family transporter [Devosia sp.]
MTSLAQRDATPLRGIVLGALSYSLFAFHDAVVKSVISELPVVQILFVRSLVIVAGCLLIGRTSVVADFRRATGKRLMLLRAVLTLAAWCMYYSMGRYLQLAEMTTLYYVAPVITIVLAVILLGERLTLARVFAAGLGFVGIIVACNPAGLSIAWPEALCLGAAFLWAVAMIAMRRIPKTDSALAQILAINVVYVLAMGVASAFVWQQMDPRTIALVVLTGLLGGAAQYILVDAARLVPASVLGTVEYSALAWSFLFGFLGWGETPALYVYVGAALVVVAGAFVAYTESRRGAIIETP